MKKIPAEKLNMVLALHYLHGLSKKQINQDQRIALHPGR